MFTHFSSEPDFPCKGNAARTGRGIASRCIGILTDMEKRIKHKRKYDDRPAAKAGHDARRRHALEELVKYLARRAAERDHEASKNVVKKTDRHLGGNRDSR